ncbi:MAG: hypothetical protein WDZ83_18555 [Rhizobiaceae bacterium]
MPSYNRWIEYGIGIALVAVVVWGSAHWYDPWSLVFAKAAAAPLFFLAVRGVKLTFVSEASRTPWTFPFLERHALHALVWGCFWVILMWRDEMTFQRATTGFVFMFALWFCASLVLDFTRRKDG